MKKILLVKTSSLGDIVHNLPVASDIRAALPGAEIDWVVEQSFAAIPRMHPAVARLLPVEVRRWRSSWWRGDTRAQVGAFLNELRRQSYDAVIDTQGLLKSAVIARAARGARFGLDFSSAREPLSLFYDRTYSVPWTLHAVERNRRLAALALGYTAPAGVEYGVRARRPDFGWLPAGRYAILVHATSAREKLWPENNWAVLGRTLASGGQRCVLPWGSADERARSERIAAAIPNAIVPPLLALDELASLLTGASAVAGVDTGITHLAAALKTVTVGIYGGPWDPAATGLYGSPRAVNLGAPGTPPTTDEVLAALDRLGVYRGS